MKEEDLKLNISKLGLHSSLIYGAISQAWFMVALVITVLGRPYIALLAALFGFIFIGSQIYSKKYFKSLNSRLTTSKEPPLVQV